MTWHPTDHKAQKIPLRHGGVEGNIEMHAKKGTGGKVTGLKELGKVQNKT